MKARFVALIAVAVAAASYGYSKFNQPKIVAWGDSLTDGSGSQSKLGYPDLLKQDGFNVVKKGFPGQASSDIALREGALNPVLTLKELKRGEYIVLDFKPVGDFRKYTPRSYYGKINGIPVVLKRLSDNSWMVFSEKKLKCTNNCYYKTNEWITRGKSTYIFWVGRNNDMNFTKFISRDLELMTRSVPKGSKFIVIGVTPSQQDDPSSLNSIRGLNVELSNKYKENFIDMWKEMNSRGIKLANIKPNKNDKNAIKKGLIASSLYNDHTHFNDAGTIAVYKIIKEKI
ncbi:hypothetical protein [Lelliottia amnigena]|uniref:hypothetical protein n=1 Tax=Lelliottia amnigena TaxID=61646 RepID=UPI001C5CAB2E|nr:hypothetical protein [Lelliottia amnigena]MCE9967133.1 hypothetical protein [Lelliottia amnigena]QXZ17683.1 hypothetical protein I6L75_11025 [Lelliottia amnigena]